jgi:hypothetical protein
VTLELADDSPVLTLPWIITFGPLSDDEEWEPVVCGPYERPHALALAESVVADEDLMAVVEPIQQYVAVDVIRKEIVAARLAAEEEAKAEAEARGGGERDLDFHHDDDVDGDAPHGESGRHAHGTGYTEPTPAPSPDEVRAGFARIAAQLSDSRA